MIGSGKRLFGRVLIDVTVEAGQTKDVGDVKLQPPDKTMIFASPAAAINASKPKAASSTEQTKSEASSGSAATAPVETGESLRRAVADDSGGSPSLTPAARLQIRGRVLGPDGQPHRGASVWVREPFAREWTRIAGTYNNGRFNASIDRTRLDAALAKNPDAKVRLAATAKGYGLAWADVDASALKEEVTLNLLEDMPVEGRIVTMEGEPAVGVSVSVTSVPSGTGVDEYIKSAPGSSGVYFNWSKPIGGGPEVEPVVTNADGRFRFEGLGAERVIRMEATGGGIGATRLAIMTRSPPADDEQDGMIAVKQGLGESVYYARFTHIAIPGRTLQGIVTDALTGEPLGDVRVKTWGSWESMQNPVTTGADGRYEITGVPTAQDYRLYFETTSSLHFNKVVKVANTAGLEPITADVALPTGIVVRGRMTQSQNGKPLTGTVVYNPLFPNQHWSKLGEAEYVPNPAATSLIRKDGTYQIVVLPGPGAIGARLRGDGYLRATVDADRLKQLVGEREVHTNEHGEVRFLATAAGDQARQGMFLGNHQALALLNLSDQATEQTINLTAKRGRSRRGTIKDDAGRPLAGVNVTGLGTDEPLKTAEFTVKGLAPRRKRTLLFVHHERQLGAQVVVTGDVTTPLTVRMTPTGTLTGRFVDKLGEPLSDIDVELIPNEPPIQNGFWRSESDEDGRFVVTGLIPGTSYSVHAKPIQQPGPTLGVQGDVRVASGESLDLGAFTQKNQYHYRRVNDEPGEPGEAE